MCEYLGSMRDMGEDIKWRKILAIEASNQLKIYDNKNESTESMFWAYFPLQLRNLDNNTFSSRTIIPFQRRLLRTYALNVKWPNIVKNEDVYGKTAPTESSNIIRKRILKWFGRVIRAGESTPVTRAFNYANTPYQRPRRKPTSTWLSIIKSDFRNLNVAWDEAINTAIDITKTWETIVNDS